MDEKTILITSCNGLVAAGHINCLHDNGERKIRVIGTDMKDIGIGSRKVDKFYKVPSASSDKYVDSIFKICKENRVDVLFVLNDEEFFLTKEKDRFKEIGAIIAMNDFDVIKKAGDKGDFFNELKENSLPYAQFKIPKNIEDFEKYCKELGYPNKPIVMKPRSGRGNRGFRIIQPKFSKREIVLEHKPGVPYITFSEVEEILSEKEDFPNIVLMEYLIGKEYSVDILVKNGDPLIIVPKIRVESSPGQSMVAEVELNPEVIDLVTKICNHFKFNYNINIQLKYGEDGKLYPYEINPRVAATISACKAAGANLFYYGVKQALGEKIPNVEIKEGLRLIRYYGEHYEMKNQNDKGSSI